MYVLIIDAEDEVISALNNILNKVRKTVFSIIVNGNFNIELGQVKYSRTASLFILDGVNERGKRCIQLCTEKELVVGNT